MWKAAVGGSRRGRAPRGGVGRWRDLERREELEVEVASGGAEAVLRGSGGERRCEESVASGGVEAARCEEPAGSSGTRRRKPAGSSGTQRRRPTGSSGARARWEVEGAMRVLW
jgi:hypothetical protein